MGTEVFPWVCGVGASPASAPLTCPDPVPLLRLRADLSRTPLVGVTGTRVVAMGGCKRRRSLEIALAVELCRCSDPPCSSKPVERRAPPPVRPSGGDRLDEFEDAASLPLALIDPPVMFLLPAPAESLHCNLASLNAAALCISDILRTLIEALRLAKLAPPPPALPWSPSLMEVLRSAHAPAPSCTEALRFEIGIEESPPSIEFSRDSLEKDRPNLIAIMSCRPSSELRTFTPGSSSAIMRSFSACSSPSAESLRCSSL
mmetsp:Transcript_55967/g.132803  ORF Transcript_55967/g.132803 Transcript_55967/m.132803 type:complete len:259 (-) Transcript_55967:8-784(-)